MSVVLLRGNNIDNIVRPELQSTIPHAFLRYNHPNKICTALYTLCSRKRISYIVPPLQTRWKFHVFLYE